MNEAGELFRRYSLVRLEKLGSYIDDCLGRLTPEQIWSRGGEEQNSVGTLTVHLCGNVHERITLTLTGGHSTRDRDGEFDPQVRVSTEQLRQMLKSTISEAVAALGKFPLERLAEHAPKPGYDRSVLENIYTVVEHFALHTGQIIFATKQLTHKGLGDMTRSSKPKA